MNTPKTQLGDPNVKGILVKDYINAENLFDAPVVISKSTNSREFFILRERAIKKGLFERDADVCSFITTKGQRFTFISKNAMNGAFGLVKNLLQMLKIYK